MANLVQLSNDLEFVPKEQLIQMSQDPNSQYPSYLVLSEIQRRTQMEKMYDAQKPKPQTSVAEELVAEFAGSPSGLGAMAQSPDLQQAFPSGDMGNMAPPSPMQMMAAGGRTGSEQIEKELNRALLEKRIANMSYREKENYADKVKFQKKAKNANPFRRLFEMQGFNEDGVYLGNLPSQGSGLSDIYSRASSGDIIYGSQEKYLKQLNDKIKNLRNELKISKMGMASGGRTGYMAGGALPYPKPKTKFQAAGEYLFDKASDVGQWAKNNPVDAAFLGLTFVPGVGWALRGGKMAVDAVNKAVKGKNVIKSMYTKAKPLDVKVTPTPKILGGKGLSAADDLGYGSGSSSFGKITGDRVFSPKRYTGSLAGGYGTYKGVEYGMSPAANQDIATIPIGMGENKLNFNLNPSKSGIAGFRGPVETNEEDALSKVEEDSDKGLGQRFKDFATSPDNADMLIGLGGAIGSARNLGELSSGISDAYRGVISDRAAVKQAGLQGRLLEAQIAKYEADVANMGVNQIIAEMNAINKGVESGAIQINDEIQAYMTTLRERLDELRSKTGTGFAASEAPTGGDMGILEKTKIPA